MLLAAAGVISGLLVKALDAAGFVGVHVNLVSLNLLINVVN